MAVPGPIRNRVWLHFRPGQEKDKKPSEVYLQAAHDAINAVALKEGKGALPMKIRSFVTAVLLAALPAWGQAPNPCAGMPDDTPAVQAAVTAGPSPINFDPTKLYCIDARVGIRIPSDRTLRGNGATVGILPGCAQVSCKAFETIPDSSNIRIENLTVVGDLTPAIGFSSAIRGDSVTGFEVENVTLRSWRSDGVWLGGNGGTVDARLTRVTVEDFGRNGIAVVNGVGFTIDRLVCRRANPGANPGACVLAEGNPGDQWSALTIIDSLAENAVVGYYIHSGKGRQGNHASLLRSVASGCSKYGVILNSTLHAFILDNLVFAPAPVAGQPIPVGISVGATTIAGQPAILAEDVVISGNYVSGTTRSAILAGVKKTFVISNTWVGGSLLPVAPAAGIPATDGVQVSVP